jgi:hypothetical protein
MHERMGIPWPCIVVGAPLSWPVTSLQKHSRMPGFFSHVQ